MPRYPSPGARLGGSSLQEAPPRQQEPTGYPKGPKREDHGTPKGPPRDSSRTLARAWTTQEPLGALLAALCKACACLLAQEPFPQEECLDAKRHQGGKGPPARQGGTFAQKGPQLHRAHLMEAATSPPRRPLPTGRAPRRQAPHPQDACHTGQAPAPHRSYP